MLTFAQVVGVAGASGTSASTIDWSFWGPAILLPFFAGGYLAIDAYLVTKQFWKAFGVGVFWVLGVVYILLGLFAYSAMQKWSYAKILDWVGKSVVAHLMLVFISATAALTIMQSFTLKFSNAKVLDVAGWIEGFRLQVFGEIGARVAEEKRLRGMKLAQALAKKFKGNLDGIRNAASQVMQLLQMPLADIQNKIAEIEAHAAKCHTDPVIHFATLITQIDPEFADQLLAPAAASAG